MLEKAAKNYYEHPRPGVATDMVLFKVKQGEVHILMIERGENPHRGKLALPGGFLRMDEDLDACVMRELAEETGVTSVKPHHFANFSTPGRDERWVVSAAYFALLPHDAEPLIQPGSDAAAAGWYSLDEVRSRRLAFDHGQIIEAAISAVGRQLDNPSIAREVLGMMPPCFTLREVQHTNEQFLGETLDRGNFRRKLKLMHLMDQIERTGETQKPDDSGKAPKHRPAEYYRLRSKSA
jgi:8-oxo-dGTP diphosphatase